MYIQYIALNTPARLRGDAFCLPLCYMILTRAYLLALLQLMANTVCSLLSAGIKPRGARRWCRTPMGAERVVTIPR